MSKAVTLDAQAALSARYQDAPQVSAVGQVLEAMLTRGSCRSFQERAVPDAVLDVVCAAALAAPSKSDLQQRDIVIVRSEQVRTALARLVAGQAWVADAPLLIVFCGNNRRQRLIHEWHGVPFANDHLDAFFNAVGDAAIALGAFVTAAEAVGLGCCPISAVRNEAAAVSDLLDLPDHAFPFAGLAVGYPKEPPKVSMRLPLRVTRHVDRYDETGLHETVADYDATRSVAQPFARQRFVKRFGEADAYGWSVDKARQYAEPERTDFGAFVRAKGFRLD